VVPPVMHRPLPSQESPDEHALPSLQAEPEGLGAYVQPVLGAQVPTASWHWVGGVLQAVGVPKQEPASSQVSLLVQALLSLQEVPLGFLLATQLPFEQVPVEVKHEVGGVALQVVPVPLGMYAHLPFTQAPGLS
jgi:hypothetical protein